MKAGLSSYTYTWAVGVPGSEPGVPLDAPALLHKAREYGLQVVQIADNLPLHRMDKYTIGKLSSLAGDLDIEIEVGSRGLTNENLVRYINIAAMLRSRILRFVIDEPGYEPPASAVIGVIRKALKYLEKNGITLALENHDRFHSMVFREIIETIGHPLAGICLDSVNSLGIGEGLDSVVENLAPFTVNLHVKDFIVKRADHKMGFLVEGVPAGKGFLDLPRILEKLRPWGRCQSAILELWTPPAASLDETIERENSWALESIRYIKQIIS